MWHVLHINNIIIFLFCFLNWIKKKKIKKKIKNIYIIFYVLDNMIKKKKKIVSNIKLTESK